MPEQVKNAPERATQPATPLGQVIDLFDELATSGKTIEHVTSQEVGFPKSEILFQISGLSLLSRRIIDVVYYIVAQSLQADSHSTQEGRGTYLDLYARKAGEHSYTVDQALFRWLLGTKSRNWMFFRKAFREAQGAALEVYQDPTLSQVGARGTDRAIANLEKEGKPPQRWVSVPLLGAVAVKDGKVFFEVHPALVQQIQDPKTPLFLSLRYVFRSLFAKLLYEWILGYLEQGSTPWVDVPGLKKILDCESKTYKEFRYLSRQVLKPAITEIGLVTGITLELETRREDRKVAYVRLVFEPVSPQAAYDPARELEKLYVILREEFGLTLKQLDMLAGDREQYSVQRLQDAVEYTRHAIRQGRVKSSPSGYLWKALQEGYKLAKAQLVLENNPSAADDKPTQAAPQEASAPNPYAEKHVPMSEQDKELRQTQCAAGWQLYRAMAPRQRKEVLNRYAGTIQARLAALHDKIYVTELEENIEKKDLLTHVEFGIYLSKLDRAE